MGYNKRVPKGEPHMKYQVTHNVTRNGKVIVSKGDVITESQVTKKKVKNYVVPYVGSKNRYTREEIEVIVKSYVKNDSRKSVMNEFVTVYPDSVHTPDSIMSMVCQLENIDNTKNGGVYHLTQLLVEVSSTLYPTRFG